MINVDDGSPDGTGVLADEWAAKEPRVIAVHRPGKMGLGTAYIAGFRKAFSLGATHVLTMDADFSHNPRYIPSMVAMANDSDLVIGSRYVDGGGMIGCAVVPQRIKFGSELHRQERIGFTGARHNGRLPFVSA